MVFAKNAKSAAVLSKQIEQNTVKKRYYAVIKGVPEEKSGILKDLLFRDKQKNKSFTVKRMRKGVREASLEYVVIGENGGFSMVEILLHTGRTHQIRVQFSSRKMPLSGDGRYGGGSGNLALFAHTLEFSHPVSGEKMVFSDKPDMTAEPWNMF
ncbi:MAG: RNA pseudouridine synthase [Clostridia bacterium]|nr:RNA pseudouridine synthase [Clostridia bacterium]